MQKKLTCAHPVDSKIKASGIRATEKLIIDAEAEAQKAQIRKLRLARLELEVFGPKPLLGKRSKMSLLRKAVP